MAEELIYTVDPNNPCRVFDQFGKEYNYCPPSEDQQTLPELPYPTASPGGITPPTIGKLKVCSSKWTVKKSQINLPGGGVWTEVAPADAARVFISFDYNQVAPQEQLGINGANPIPVITQGGTFSQQLKWDDFGPLIGQQWMFFNSIAGTMNVVEIVANS